MTQTSSTKGQIQGQTMRPNVVYLHTFPPTPHVYNISPFAIKVESFLRLYGISYETVYTNKFGPKGQMPYVKLNGEIIPDSNVIIPRLKKEFDIDEELTPSDMAVGHAITRMIEEHTAQIGFYYRYGLHMQDFLSCLDIPNRLFSADTSRKGRMICNLWGRFQPTATHKKTKMRGLSRHTDEEMWDFSNDDLKAVSDFLGDKPFFFGDKATTIDCVLFGHLVQFLLIPLDFPQKEFMEKNCTNIVRFVERFRKAYWKDWDEKCNERVVTMYEKAENSSSSGVASISSRYLLVMAAGVAAASAAIAYGMTRSI